MSHYVKILTVASHMAEAGGRVLLNDILLSTSCQAASLSSGPRIIAKHPMDLLQGGRRQTWKDMFERN